jgi:hypothetical protein
MIDLDLWFPEDFDKRYFEYRKRFEDKKMPDPFLAERLEKAREDLLSINDEEEYQHEIDKWRPLKLIVDAIYKELSPFAEKAQSVKIDLSKLGISENQAGPILLMLVYERVCRWKITNSAVVISTAQIHEYLGGDRIVVPDYEKFQELRKEINDFYKFMEFKKEEKFPKVKPLELANDFKTTRQGQTEALERALEKGLEKEALKDEIASEIKLAGKYRGVESPTQPVIEYNDVTGKGSVDSVRGQKEFTFKDGSPEYKVFKMLYAKLRKKSGKLERLDVLVAGGFYEDHQQELDPARKTAETALINDIAKNIREKTGLNTKELVMNNGNLTLLATKKGKTPPKTTKSGPV